MTDLEQLIAREIESKGPISFARFMEMALYTPNLGYYEQASPGKSGDFYTSVSVGSLFGELMAFEFARRFDLAGGNRLQIVECGAHDGRFAEDVLRWMQQWRPDLFSRLQYWIVEPSEIRRKWQQTRLQEFPVCHAKSFADIPPADDRILFSNELLDAMPLHVLKWSHAGWQEWGVGLAENRFHWQALEQTSLDQKDIPAFPEPLLQVLPDQYTIELCPAAIAWWQSAARFLGRGSLITLDYGLTLEEWIIPERTQGTLRAYHKHQLAKEILQNAGEQDLTAHVQFSSLIEAGEQLGLTTEQLESQSRFLTHIAGRTWENPNNFGEWTTQRRRQFQTLTHPQHMGQAFRVLIQTL